MSFEEILAQVRDLDIKLWVEQDRLRYSAPRGALSSTLRDALIQRKAEIVAFLQEAQQIVTSTNDQAAVAAAQDGTSPVDDPQAVVTGSYPLTPRMISFFTDKANQIDPHNYASNTIHLFELAQSVEPAWLRETTRQLLLHHDGLRLRFERAGTSWQPWIAEPDAAVPFEVFDLTGVPEADEVTQFDALAARFIDSLNLSTGPLIKVALFDRGRTKPGYILILLHHLVTDGFSNMIVSADFESVYRQLSQGQPVVLPPKTTSVKTLVQSLWTYAQSAELLQELPYWLEQPWAAVQRLPTDLDIDPLDASQASSQIVESVLSREQTERLFQILPRLANTRLQDIILAAITIAITRWTGQRAVLFEMISNGRNWTPGDLDLSRTVGWLASHAPILLDVGDAQTPQQIFRAVRTQLHSIPNDGVGFELLSYLRRDPQIAQQLADLPNPEIMINFWGYDAHPLMVSQLFYPAQRFQVPPRNIQNTRFMALEIGVFVVEHQLHVQWNYSTEVYYTSTIEQLADSFLDAMYTLIDTEAAFVGPLVLGGGDAPTSLR